jgi:hypothetical protein
MSTEYSLPNPAGGAVIRPVHGSSRAGQFLKDVIQGIDSVDIVVFGDSNAGSDASYGYTGGWMDSLASLGIKQYATPIWFTNAEAGNSRVNGLVGRFTYMGWNGDTAAGGGGTNAYSLGNRIAASTASAVAAAVICNRGPAEVYYVRCNTATASTTSTVTLDLSASPTDDAYNNMWLAMGTGHYRILDYNGSTKVATIPTQGAAPTATTYTITTGGLRPAAFRYEPSHVSASTNYYSQTSGPSIRLNPYNALAGGNGAGAQDLQYRVVRSAIGSGGQYKLRAMYAANTTIAASSAFISTAAGSSTLPYATDYTNDSLNFTTTVTGGVPDEIKCAWDGYNVSPASDSQVTGPLTVFWHSVIARNTKGYSVSCLNYNGGATTENLADQVYWSARLIEMALQELRQRQIAAGGSGRVIWYHNSGINGSETPESYITNVSRIIDEVSRIWGKCGFPPSDLSFIVTATHPVVEGDTGAGTWWRQCGLVNSGAKQWVASTSYGDRVTFCDLSALISAQQLKSRNLYQLLSNNLFAAHLRSPILLQIPNDPVAKSVPAWSAARTYAIGEVVSLSGTNYYCIAATTNNTPPNATYWYALPAGSSGYGSSAANGNLWGTSGTNVRFSSYTAANYAGNYGVDIQVASNGYLAMVLNMINSITAYV